MCIGFVLMATRAGNPVSYWAHEHILIKHVAIPPKKLKLQQMYNHFIKELYSPNEASMS